MTHARLRQSGGGESADDDPAGVLNRCSSGVRGSENVTPASSRPVPMVERSEG
jgi:hypothetical protein